MSHADSKFAKAARLVVEDRITEVDARVFSIKGDTGTYLVTILDKSAPFVAGRKRICTCAAGRTGSFACSHILAATSVVERSKPQDDSDPFEGIAAAHAGDRSRDRASGITRAEDR